MTPIEKIRAEVEEVRREHQRVQWDKQVSAYCTGGGTYPCPTLRLAEDKLNLAEVLLEAHAMECPTYDDRTGECKGCFISTVLSEVSS